MLVLPLLLRARQQLATGGSSAASAAESAAAPALASVLQPHPALRSAPAVRRYAKPSKKSGAKKSKQGGVCFGARIGVVVRVWVLWGVVGVALLSARMRGSHSVHPSPNRRLHSSNRLRQPAPSLAPPAEVAAAPPPCGRPPPRHALVDLCR